MQPEFDEVEIRRLVTKQVESLTGTSAGEDDDLFDLGLTSANAALLSTWIEATFGVPVTMRTVFERPEIGLLVAAIAQPPGGGDRT
ncbi:acyl carrier protein [Streptomyces sp. NBC_01591]|uniref:acyl carrier protein n=1 Tax=Streptomyces sp. NBC_01591 TaxID=2975888 RepID=UPI002DDA2E43|nr:acyl carrier protein [Streptomyces sp. NBC_01591]WSD71860.1 acyl carrier protein [Streptomyces sp. NBC_01591]